MVTTMVFECGFQAKGRFKNLRWGAGEASEIGSKVLGSMRSFEMTLHSFGILLHCAE
jgi:hypothetical protein